MDKVLANLIAENSLGRLSARSANQVVEKMIRVTYLNQVNFGYSSKRE
ncbi:MAG: hypothetical protein AB7V18_03910 [Pyrinomonadaceae bacterium]